MNSAQRRKLIRKHKKQVIALQVKYRMLHGAALPAYVAARLIQFENS